MRNGDDDQTVYVKYLISNKLRQREGGLVSAGGKRIQVTPPGSGRFLLALNYYGCHRRLSI
jgi:hypothetical protein